MKNKKSNLFLVFFLIFCLFLSMASVVSADPTVNSITTEPESPKPLSTFTVIADISGENIISVKVTISECTEGPPSEQCFVPHYNLVMELNDEGKYETEVTLTGTQASIDHVQYLFTIDDNGTEYALTEKDWRTYLDIDSDNGGTNGGGDENGSPGFELVLILIAVSIAFIIYRKKR
jgi:hypothetical protein